MPRFDSFLGPFDTRFSPNIQSEQTINWIPERNAISVEGQGTDVHDKNVRCTLIRTPGLKLFVTLPQAPVRGVFPGEYRLFAVGGAHFYEILSSGTIIDRSTPGFTGASGVGPAGGTLAVDNNPAQAFFNGNQMLIISGGYAYVDNGNGPVQAQYSDPLTDLVIDPANANKLTTATGGFFDSSDVGRTIQILSGAGFNVGMSQVITAVDSNGEASGASAWGVAGSSLGTGVEWLGYRTWTDLYAPSGFLLESASMPFSASDVGTSITITSGSPWIPGTYKITGLAVDSSGNPTGTAMLNTSAAATPPPASNGVGSTPAQLVKAFQGAFLDGYGFICPDPLTKSVFYSGAPDGTSDFTMWDPLNYFEKARYPDNVNALYADHEELYTAGDLECTEVWRDVGDANNPFMPDPGAIMHLGCQAPFSFSRLGNGVAWIAQDTRRGTRQAVQAVGYQPQIISTPAIEAHWAQYSTIADAVAYTIYYQGHELWVISFPTGNETWVYDAATGFWFEWGLYVGGTALWERHLVWVHCVVALDKMTDVHYGGDWATGRIYQMSRSYVTDNGTTVVRRRRAPHITNENMRRFYSRFEIDCDVTGLERIFWNRLGNGRDRIWQMDVTETSEITGPTGPTITLSFSDDRTQSWQQMFTQNINTGVDLSLANAYLNWVDATWH